jgi:hypothetical protein
MLLAAENPILLGSSMTVAPRFRATSADLSEEQLSTTTHCAQSMSRFAQQALRVAALW